MGEKQSKAARGGPARGAYAGAAPTHMPGGGGGAAAAYPRSQTVDFQRKYGFIPDQFSSLQQVQDKLREVGLESSNLIVGVDFTKSNEWTGRRSFGGKCLHAIGPETNPYEMAISIIGEALAPFDEDNLIPCYGFGDVTTHDHSVFSFYPEDRPCNGFDDALWRYRSIVPHVKLSGPTSFAPIIEAAVRTVEMSGGQYHVLLIIADGQVTRSEDLGPNELSDQERATVEAIGAASNYPLSIVLVGVGDGPWETMQAFDDVLPHRNFDNFQFVNVNKVMASTPGGPLTQEQRAAKFALMALMEVPAQYKACGELKLIGKRVGRMPPRPPLPPPPAVMEADRRTATAQHHPPTQGFAPQGPGAFPQPPSLGAPGGDPGVPESQECPVCLQFPKDTAFQCGHQACSACARKMQECPICRTPIAMRIKLYA